MGESGCAGGGRASLGACGAAGRGSEVTAAVVQISLGFFDFDFLVFFSHFR